MQDWPVHKESCKCARKKSKVPGKQKICSTTKDELRSREGEWAECMAFLASLPCAHGGMRKMGCSAHDKPMSLLMEQLAKEPDCDAKKAVMESLPHEFLRAEREMQKMSKTERRLNALNLSPYKIGGDSRPR